MGMTKKQNNGSMAYSQKISLRYSQAWNRVQVLLWRLEYWKGLES